MTNTTLLLRQIHPNHVQNGFASSVTFRPNDADKGLLSVYDGDLIDAENSWNHYITIGKKQSFGVVGLQVEECATLGLTCSPDPAPFPEHAVIDFTSVDEKHWRSISKKLHAKALARGWLFRASLSE